MKDAVKYIEFLGDLKSDKIYYLYKTSSSEINLEILSQLQKYESSLDFFSHYTKNDIKILLNCLNQLDKNYTSIFNDNSNNFSSNTEKYISQISKIILSLSLILKTQETLNKLLIKSKKYLNEISKNCKIENIYHDKLLSLINNLEYSFFNDISSYNNFSMNSTKVNSSLSLNYEIKNVPKILSEVNNNKIQEDFFNDKKCSIVNEEILSDVQTPAFIEKKSNRDNINTTCNDFNNNVSNDNDFNISLRDMVFILDPDTKTNDNSPMGETLKYKKEKFYKNALSFHTDKVINRRSLSIKSELLNIKPLDEEGEIKMYRDFLLLIKKLYKSCLITAEERIEIKKLIISKSKKIIDFYIKEFEDIKDDYLKSANAIKNLL